MAMKNLSVLDREAGLQTREAQADDLPPALKAKILSGAMFDEPGLPFLDEQPRESMEAERFEDDDFEIALVPRRIRAHRTGPIVPPSPRMDRVLYLSLTWRELLDRVRRELHQASSLARKITRFGDVQVNLLTMEVSRSEDAVELTAREFKLLRFFIKNPERVFSRNELLNEVWGYNNYPSTRTVDNHICMLRQKLEPIPADPIHFLTVHGMGYKFVP